MSKSSKWKSNLISSSLPLEFETARLLVSMGFLIDADFTYARNDSGVIKDFSVDLNATGFPPFSDPNEIHATLELLIECKQRRPNIHWLFLPDPNQPDFSPITLGKTIQAVDEFSWQFFPSNATVSFDKNMQFCYKGIEVNELNGDVSNSELRHGIAQLQYALPRLLTQSVLLNVGAHRDDNHPFLYCPILLTNATIFVANHDLTTTDVEKSSSIKDIAKEVKFMVFYSDYGPDFESHCQRECAPLAKFSQLKIIREIKDYRREHGEYEHRLPTRLGTSLARGERFALLSFFPQFVVCNLNHFPSLINRIKRITAKAVRGLAVSSSLPKL